ncbi:unnamed protein product [Rotaria magnacalcarata]
MHVSSSLDKITEWNLNPSLIDELVDSTKCQPCLSEPLYYVCGTDGRVYRSACFVAYFNCLLDANIEIACNKESPCNHSSLDEQNFESIDSNRNENIIPDPLVDDSPDDPKGRSIENCHPMVSYMFYRFDTTNDSELNDDELNSIEHLKDESCTDIFFQRCDHDGDHRLFPYELFNCFQYALLPCELHNQDLDKAFWNKSMEGIFRPRCNSNVYYAARQCNLNTPRECWCVNKHGIEVEGTRQYDDHMPQCDEIEDSRTTEIV